MSIRTALSVLLIAVIGAAPVAAAPKAAPQPDATQRLEQLLGLVKGLRANFTQVLLDADLKVVRETSGRFVLSRPGKFRWDYTQPYTQTIVGDGERVWMYDADLKQVTVKRMDETLASSPAVLLGGGGSISDGFTVTDRGADGSFWWVELVPKVKDTEFERVRLGFGERFVEVMELHDTLGQLTRITFKDGVLNPAIDPRQFRFTPPAGVDVLGDEADRP